jgi:hypothetical protein
MEELDIGFVTLVTEFLHSSERIRDATELIDGDPVKQEMIQDIRKDFDESCGRAEALRLLVENSYPESREFILSELREVTILNNQIADTIQKRLAPLLWN